MVGRDGGRRRQRRHRTGGRTSGTGSTGCGSRSCRSRRYSNIIRSSSRRSSSRSSRSRSRGRLRVLRLLRSIMVGYGRARRRRSRACGSERGRSGTSPSGLRRLCLIDGRRTPLRQRRRLRCLRLSFLGSRIIRARLLRPPFRLFVLFVFFLILPWRFPGSF